MHDAWDETLFAKLGLDLVSAMPYCDEPNNMESWDYTLIIEAGLDFLFESLFKDLQLYIYQGRNTEAIQYTFDRMLQDAT